MLQFLVVMIFEYIISILIRRISRSISCHLESNWENYDFLHIRWSSCQTIISGPAEFIEDSRSCWWWSMIHLNIILRLEILFIYLYFLTYVSFYIISGIFLTDKYRDSISIDSVHLSYMKLVKFQVKFN